MHVLGGKGPAGGRVRGPPLFRCYRSTARHCALWQATPSCSWGSCPAAGAGSSSGVACTCWCSRCQCKLRWRAAHRTCRTARLCGCTPCSTHARRRAGSMLCMRSGHRQAWRTCLWPVLLHASHTALHTLQFTDTLSEAGAGAVCGCPRCLVAWHRLRLTCGGTHACTYVHAFATHCCQTRVCICMCVAATQRGQPTSAGSSCSNGAGTPASPSPSSPGIPSQALSPQD